MEHWAKFGCCMFKEPIENFFNLVTRNLQTLILEYEILTDKLAHHGLIDTSISRLRNHRLIPFT